LTQPRHLPQRAQPRPGVSPVLPPGRHYLLGVDASPGRSEVSGSDAALAHDPHGGKLAAGNPTTDGVARDSDLPRGLRDRQEPGRRWARVISHYDHASGRDHPVSLAAAIAAGDGTWAWVSAGRWPRRGRARGTRVPAPAVLATRVPTDDQLQPGGRIRPGAAELVATRIAKALAGTAGTAARRLAVTALGGCGTTRCGPKERSGEQRAPGGTPGSWDPEEARETIEGLVVHRLVLRTVGGVWNWMSLPKVGRTSVLGRHGLSP
jgi:hypothetical protein